MRHLLSLLLLFLALPCLASSGITMTIQVVGNETTERHWTQYVPGQASRSQTNCTGSTTAINSGVLTTANGDSTCSTTSAAGYSAHAIDHAVEQTRVQAILPNGSHVQLWCQAGIRHCAQLSPGTYSAQVKGDKAWVYIYRIDGTLRKIKYRSAGVW
jgi:hypothetical protein